MKNRLLLTLFTAILTSGLAISLLFSYFLSKEKLNSIDFQLRETAYVLMNSNLSKLEYYDLVNTDEMINITLGQNRIGKLFYILNNKKEVLFRSKATMLANVLFPTSPTFFTTTANKKTYRVLNLNLPQLKDRTLQIALILDTEELDLLFIFRRIVVYMIMISFPIFLISVVLTRFLFRPITEIAFYLRQVGIDLKNTGEIPPQPEIFKLIVQRNDNDEFSILIQELNSFLEKLKLYNKVTKPWSYRLAHEIKTPLSYAFLEINELEKKDISNEKSFYLLKKNLNKVSHLITNFLDWSISENSFSNLELYAINVEKNLQELVHELNIHHQSRIRINCLANFTLICNQLHFTTLLNNLITNSLKYSQDEIIIEVNSYYLKILDKGGGLPELVEERLGQPFNFGSKNKDGSGLGLAWVITICHHYYWKYSSYKENDYWALKIVFTKNRYGLEV